jgi:DNA-damage-inducible protein D
LKAKVTIETSGDDVNNHFVELNKMVRLGSGSEREVEDIMLTRYACYIVAMN